MFDFQISKNGVSVLERTGVVPQVVIAALQILTAGEVLTVSFSTNTEK